MDADRQFRLLVPCDISPPSEAALRVALVLAKALGASIDLLHVFQYPSFAFMEAAYIPTSEEIAVLRQTATDVTAAMVKRVAEPHPGIRIDTQVRNGAVLEEIFAAIDAGTRDLVVMGTHGRGFWSRALLGSVAQAVVRRSAVPLLTVHAPDATYRTLQAPPSKILVPVEFDSVSNGALDTAFALAKRLGSAVRVQFSYGLFDVGYPLPSGVPTQLIDEAARAHLGRIVEERRLAGVPFEMATFVGSAVSGILDAAKDGSVGMIVMGTHQRKGVSRLLEGSVAEDIVRLAPCPVLTVGDGARPLVRS
jgi:nucleotide-binding universal stress UspA family protein